MGPDEDDFEEQEPLPDPTLRSWRHPSELAAVAAMAAREEPPPRRRRLAYGSLLLGGVLGALAVVGVLTSSRLVGDDSAGSRFELREPAGSVMTAGRDGSTEPPVAGDDPETRTTTAAPGSATTEVTTTTAVPSSSAQPSTTNAPPARLQPLHDELGAAAGPAVPAEAIVGVAVVPHEVAAPRCTGLVIDGMVVTSASAIGDATTVSLVVGGTSLPGTVVGRDAFTDIALVDPDVDTPLHELPPAGPIGDDAPVALVATDGRPEPITVAGRITGWGKDGTSSDGHDLIGLVSTSARLPDAGAGALLLDTRGALVGMVVDTPGHLALAVPEATLRMVARSLRDTGHPVPVWVGVSVVERPEGVVLDHVVAGGPADAAGLREDDVVTSLNRVPVSDLPAFFTTVRSLGAGDRLTIGFARHGELHATDVVLAAPPVPAPPDAEEQAAD